MPYHELDPVKKRGPSKTASLHDNLIVEGDNLLALKALLPTYHGKVKCIYIDPPYNTGNEGWAYNDNVNSPMLKAWLGKTVDRDDLNRHDYRVQGWKRNRIFADFIFAVSHQNGKAADPFSNVFVLETKGKHLKENLDTRYKRPRLRPLHGTRRTKILERMRPLHERQNHAL